MKYNTKTISPDWQIRRFGFGFVNPNRAISIRRAGFGFVNPNRAISIQRARFGFTNPNRAISSILFLLMLLFSLFSPANLRCAIYEADYMPWSGYWWSTLSGALITGMGYRGHPSPLEKYDYVTSGTYDGPAAKYGWEHYYDPDALSWHGRCFTWAVTSILEPEPVHNGIYNDVTFYVGDKKGLLVAAYAGTLYNEYELGKPETLYQVLEDFIRYQKIPIIIDIGTNGESWNYPVFKYEIDYVQEGNIRHYTTTIYYAEDNVSHDFVGTKISYRTYYYYFVLDESENITESGWENTSEEFPPTYAREPFGINTTLDTGIDYDVVKEIVSTDDDGYEDNNNFDTAALLSNGTYKLVGADNDIFQIELAAGDMLRLWLTSEDEENLSWNIYDPDKSLIHEFTGIGEQVIEADSTGSYFLEIIAPESDEEPVYNLSVLQELPYQGIFPLNPSGKWGTGIALLSPDSGIGRIIITQTNKDGTPTASYTDNISSARYLLGMADDSFGLSHNNDGYIRIDADMELSGLHVNMNTSYLCSGSNLISSETASAQVFFPYVDWKDNWITDIGLINSGTQTEQIIIQSYDSQGEPILSDTIELAPGEKWEEDILYTDIFSSETALACISAAVESGNEVLTGYLKYFHRSSLFASEEQHALVQMITPTDTELPVPHIASDENWQTRIAVMNTGNDETTATFSAYDDSGNLIYTEAQVLNAKQNFVRYISDIFSDAYAGEIASVRILSDQPLCGLLFYNSLDELRLAGMPIRPAIYAPAYLSHLACSDSWWTGIGIVNAGNFTDEFYLSLFDENGELVSERYQQLNPNQRLIGTIRDLFGNDDNIYETAKYLNIESAWGQPLSGIYLMGNGDYWLMGDGITN